MLSLVESGSLKNVRLLCRQYSMLKYVICMFNGIFPRLFFRHFKNKIVFTKIC